MPENNLFTQIIPIITIVLCIGFVAVYKLISNMRSAAVGKNNPASSLKILATEQSKPELPERIESDYPVLVMQAQSAVKCTLKELSLSGAFLSCPFPRPIGEIFDIKIFYKDHDSLKLNTEVTWNNGSVPASQIVNRGMRIRFLQMSPNERLFISDLINPPSDRPS